MSTVYEAGRAREFSLFVPGIPAPQGSKRHVGHGVMVESSARVKSWRVDIVDRCTPEQVWWDGPERMLLHIHGKGGHVRLVPVPPRAAQLLAGYSWPAPMRPDLIGDRVSGALRSCGVDGTCHRLRHTYATELVRAGVDVLLVQRLLGHASVATTQIYADVDDDSLIAAVADTFG